MSSSGWTVGFVVSTIQKTIYVEFVGACLCRKGTLERTRGITVCNNSLLDAALSAQERVLQERARFNDPFSE
eukprot:scaffold7421_cov144-Skeletonema_dohrnii-CCMP3373.AAC.3